MRVWPLDIVASTSLVQMSFAWLDSICRNSAAEPFRRVDAVRHDACIPSPASVVSSLASFPQRMSVFCNISFMIFDTVAVQIGQ